ncbi:MAG TPA: DUF721 domain-containing protein [Acidimicrobiales bacterium]|nr:DUF721 domain-containing protein [Acidimicrobiales bacterium]
MIYRGRPPEHDPLARLRPPRRLRDSLDDVARRLGAPAAAPLGAVFERWVEAVGETIAAHATPLSLVDGVLAVAVDDPAWAAQLGFLADSLVEKVAQVAGEGVVSRLELRVTGGRG